MNMKLSNVSIVLVRPKNPGNIGAVARAMKNTGLRKLILIDPCDFKTPEVEKMAVGDFSILGKVRIYKGLKEALKPFLWAVATTRRARRRFKPLLSPKEVAQKVAFMKNHARIALVFGPEDMGLENAEIALCQNVSTIPAHQALPSLNLAQAVMIYAYEIYCASLRRSKACVGDLASVRELEGMYEHFEKVLRKIKFFSRGKPQRLMESIRNFLSRAALSPRDVRILRGIFSTIERRVSK